MRLFARTSRTPIGLDIGGRHVKAVQLERTRGPSGWRMAAAACFPRAAAGAALDATEIRDIAAILARRGFHGNRLVVPVPSEKLMTGVFDVPARGVAVPVDQIARMELARTSRCPPGSFEMGYWDLPTSARANRNAQVMAVGCAHGDANALLDLFESQGLDVALLDVRSCALARAASPLVSSPGQIWAILDLGWSAAMLVVLHGGAIVFSRSLPDSGIRPLHESLRDRLHLDGDVCDFLLNDMGLDNSAAPRANDQSTIDLPPEARDLLKTHVDALAQELTASLSYASQEYPDTPPTGLLLSGSNGQMPGLAELLSAVLGLDVRVLAPSQLVESRPALLESGSSPALIAALGLAQVARGDA